MKAILDTRVMIAVHLIIIATVLAVGAALYAHQKSATILKITDHIDEQEVILASLATLTHANKADEIVARIITDCPRRNEFESLLVRLGQLSKTELIEVQKLFDSCAAFYAERKALMVFRVERELEVYKSYTSLLENLSDESFEKERIQKWEELTELERKQSDLLSEQVEIQKTIISSLMQGVQVGDVEIRDQLARAQEVAEILTVHSTRAQKLHEQLGI